MNKIKLIMIIMSAMVLGACGSNEGAQDLHDRLVAAGKLEISETKGFSISSFVNSSSSPVMMDDQVPEDLAFEEGAFSGAAGADTATLAPEEPIDEPSVALSGELSPEPSGEPGSEGEYDLDTADFEVTSVAPKKENGKINTTKGIDNEAVSESASVYFVTFQDVNFAVEKNGKTVLEGEWQAVDENAISVDMNDGNKELNVELSGSKITLTDSGSTPQNNFSTPSENLIFRWRPTEN